MEKFDILKDIAQRTGGDIYIGVVGPVRTGKSTFIKRFMELLVLPHIADAHDRERARDALPQSGAGRTVMTTEPKFIPDEGVQITIKENIQMRVPWGTRRNMAPAWCLLPGSTTRYPSRRPPRWAPGR